jgi:hypothetical protein
MRLPGPVGMVILALAAAPGCGSGDAASEPATDRSSFLGVNGDRLFYPLALEAQTELLDAHLAQIASAPVSFVRSQLDWRRAEPAAPTGAEHAYDFADHDRWVAALAEHGFRWAPIVLGWPVPDWAADPAAVAAGCGSRSPPRDPSDYAAFAGELAARYGPEGSFWGEHPELPYRPVTTYELWNEPNFEAFWCPAPEPGRYGTLAVSAAREIRSIDAQAIIIFGALAPFETDPGPTPARIAPREFIGEALQAAPELAGLVDAVGVHPYGPDPAATLEAVRRFRSDVDATGLQGVPLVVNELGWPSAGASGGFTAVPEDAVRASYLATATMAIAEEREELGIAALAPYTWTSAQTNPAIQEEWFGLADPKTAEPNPVGDAFLDSAHAILAQ